MEIVIPDVGHGNCVELFDNGLSLLVDCGMQNKDKKVNFLATLLNLNTSGTKDLIITHYHFDHYNLLKYFPGEFFDSVYLPALPPKRSSSSAILKFLALAITTHYKYYPAIREIIRVAKVTKNRRNITALIMNDRFDSLKRKWEVLWPDYNIIDKRNAAIIKKFRYRIEEIEKKLEKENPELLEEFGYWYEILSSTFGGKEKYPERRKVKRKRRKRFNISYQIKKDLENLENVFRSLADRASLVFREINHKFLFTGDVDETILNHELDFGKNNYFFIEAPHHGTRYGKAFDKVSTEILLISRKYGDNVAVEFFKKLPWKILIDTARVGNSILKVLGCNNKIIVIHTRVFTIFYLL